jgi:subtilisin family serine protease
LTDKDGHGTHVAGIIAGGLDQWEPEDVERSVLAFDKEFQPRDVAAALLTGMAPRARLVSLKVLGGGGDLEARTSRALEAIAYVRRMNGNSAKVIHGVNLSLGYAFDAEWAACGQSPLCVAVDDLVRTGVVVVVASGNTGAVTLNPVYSREVRRFSAGMTINDPGNAQRAITVGSTHRESPHTSGISHFSSRGPTADGRPKPDLVAPGERIMSAAAGSKLETLAKSYRGTFDGVPVYIEDSGTSMAAPHVSGAIAAFLSVQRELIGQPEEVKRIFMATATSLRRDPNCQGAGLVDLMRALQAQ